MALAMALWLSLNTYAFLLDALSIAVSQDRDGRRTMNGGIEVVSAKKCGKKRQLRLSVLMVS